MVDPPSPRPCVHGGRAEWGAEPEFFGPRHAHREARIVRALEAAPREAEPHLECAAGVGSLSLTLARKGHMVLAADLSLRSLAVVQQRAEAAGVHDRVFPLVADITRLPLRDQAVGSATSAETLEHMPDDQDAVSELARVLRPGGSLVITVPAGPEQWSDWDEWAGHLRRYTVRSMADLLRGAGLVPKVRVWGWPLLRLYDDLFLKRVNRRRLRTSGAVQSDSALKTVAGLGRRRWLVRLVRAAFAMDRLFDGSRWGVGLLAVAAKPRPRPGEPAPCP